MPPTPVRLAVAALGLVLAALLGVVATAPLVAASGSPGTQVPDGDRAALCARTSTGSPVAVEVTTLSPRAPRTEDEPFTVTGRLVNCGTQALRSLQVRLVVGPRLTTRSQLRLATSEPELGSRRLPGQDARSAELAPGAATGFAVRVQVAALRLGQRNGVHPVAVQARARVGDGRRGPVGMAATFVPWFPEGPVAPTRVAWVVPLVDEPHFGPGEVLLDDRLEQRLQDGPDAGRLARVLLAADEGRLGACDPLVPAADGEAAADEAAPCRDDPVPMTFAVDPDLLLTVATMTEPYRVLQDGERVVKPASEHAAAWLQRLRAAVTGPAADAAVLALPYGDPDVVALSRTDSPLKDDVELLERLGESETRRLLEGVRLADVAWPPVGPAAAVVDPLAAGEGTALLLDPSALVDDPSSDRTPNARRTVPSTLDPVTALVADEVLSTLVAAGPDDEGWQGARLAEQRWIAETAIIAAERPGESRTLVVAPDRRAELQPDVAAAAIADTGRLPWLCPVRLADAAAGREGCATLPDTQGPSVADDRVVLRRTMPQVPVLAPAFVREVGQARRASDQLTEQVLLADSDEARETKARLLRARGRAVSTAWRSDPAGGRRQLDLLQADIAGLRGRISLVGRPTTLTGRVGTIQLNVQNDLDQPVNVGLRLDPTSAVRLSSSDTALQVLPARSTQQLSVRVEARTSGRFTARAGLVDASGEPFGSTVELQIRSTQYGRVALTVTAVAAVVLLLAAGARLTRRALRGPASGPEQDGG